MFDIEFYKTNADKEVIVDFLDSLPRKHRAKAISELELLAEFGTSLKAPYTKHVIDDIWELRIQFSSDISRIFYFIPYQNKIVLLHGFIKKTQKTPLSEIQIARKRKLDYLERKHRRGK